MLAAFSWSAAVLGVTIPPPFGYRCAMQPAAERLDRNNYIRFRKVVDRLPLARFGGKARSF
jgi:hypothetical protein